MDAGNATYEQAGKYMHPVASPLLAGSLHRPIEFHLQNTSSKTQLLRISGR